MRSAVLLSTPDLWQRGHGEDHPLRPERLQRTFELLQAFHVLEAENVRVISPAPASPDELELFHSREYVAAVQSLSRGEKGISPSRYNFGPGDNPVFPGMYETECLKAGSSLMGARLVVEGECEVAFSYGGGLHHAARGHASGFCVFNDAAIAIRWLVQQGLRVAYIDIDVHHGDGVQEAFYDTDRVLTISLHQDGRTLFPGTGFVEESGIGAGAGFCANLPLPPYCDDAAYLWAFYLVVPPLVQRFAPDIVVTQLGADTHYLDPLGNLSLTTHAFLELYQALGELSPRWLALGGGGYNLEVVPRAWSLAFACMAELELPDELPESYRQRFNIPAQRADLHDRQKPHINELTHKLVHERVREVVARLRQIHKLD